MSAYLQTGFLQPRRQGFILLLQLFVDFLGLFGIIDGHAFLQEYISVYKRQQKRQTSKSEKSSKESHLGNVLELLSVEIWHRLNAVLIDSLREVQNLQ